MASTPAYTPTSYTPLKGLQIKKPPQTLPLFGYGPAGLFYFDHDTVLYQDPGPSPPVAVVDSGPQQTTEGDDHELQSYDHDEAVNTVENCANLSRTWGRTWGHWVQTDLKEFGDTKIPFLNRVARICTEARILRCENPNCRRNRQSLQKVVPVSPWTNFRDWVITVISCQMSVSHEERDSLPSDSKFFHLAASITVLNGLLEEYKREGNFYDGVFLKDDKGGLRETDPFTVCEIIYWAIRVQRDFGTSDYSEGIWSPHFIPLNIYGRTVKTATFEANNLRICPNRLWNLRNATERGEVDFPALMELVKANPLLSHQGHEDCLTNSCTLTTLDSTRVHQLHKCEAASTSGSLNTILRPQLGTGAHDSTCKPKMLFDPAILNKAAENPIFWTVWSINQPPQLLEMEKKYAAISHVWSDGTGIGLGTVGEVNACLFDYFAGCIRDVGPEIEGIWWDTISIPTEPIARRKAINEMHNYYANAECTILHDTYLAEFEWKDDGSPCLAIVLSSWFTRGWTALEFIMSKNIKVIFKDPITGGRIIKDLDKDVLAQEACRTSTGHLIASSILKRLRSPIHSIHDLLSVLKPRSTSWARDKMIIAALLAEIEIQAGDTSQGLTKRVLSKFGRIDALALTHDQPTIAESGGWSWCPQSLYDMPVGELNDHGEEFKIGDDGSVDGRWYCRRVDREDTFNGIIPASSHPQVIFKIQNALKDWHNCGLLRKHSSDKGPCLLVELPKMGIHGINTAEEGQPVFHRSAIGSVLWHKQSPGEVTKEHALLDITSSECGYIGTVHVYELGRLPNGKSANPNRSSYVAGMYRIFHGGSYYHPDEPGRIGNHGLQGSNDNFAWLHRKVWIGNQTDAGTLLVPRYDRVAGKTVIQIVKSVKKVQNFSYSSNSPFSASPFTLPDQISPPSWQLETESFMTASDKDHGVFRYKAKKMIFRRIKPDPLWPPIEIPSKDRTIVGWRHTIGPDDGGDYSKDLFQVFDEEKLYTYAALDKGLLVPTEDRPYQGIWVSQGSAGPLFGMGNVHFHFALFIQQDETHLSALSLSGDQFIRRGEVIFQTNNLPRPGESELGDKPRTIDAHPPRDHQQDNNYLVKLHLRGRDEVIAENLRKMEVYKTHMMFTRLPSNLLFDLMEKDAFEESTVARRGLGALYKMLNQR
ncbi:hypothetical protein TWF106_009057 [Orbilia oligospora]|uniref:Heterokaryon incompatibility domain-containing protein n=1 Tax=Orbilia oligospora TaxID=2813651 RepID=A0A7C8UQY4_ORBOL|nr:hypothetical protein TWF106_009057 [Orbilia oligospora]